jgi:Asp/Glu/hydantoin racemase
VVRIRIYDGTTGRPNAATPGAVRPCLAEFPDLVGSSSQSDRQFHELAAAVRACVTDGAQAVIIAGGPLSATARRLTALSLAPIIEPLPTAATLAIDRLRS